MSGDVSYLVERLLKCVRFIEQWNTISSPERHAVLEAEAIEASVELKEAATALEAKDKEIEAMREEIAILRDMLLNPDPAIEPDNLRLHREKCDALDRAFAAEARAETTERELDVLSSSHRDLAKRLADMGRDRDEARAALKPFADEAAHISPAHPSGKLMTWVAFTAGDLRRAARAIMED